MDRNSYICNCGCGYTNADMFYDSLGGRKPKAGELIAYGIAKGQYIERSRDIIERAKARGARDNDVRP